MSLDREPNPTALILRSAPQERVSKDAPARRTTLRDAASRLLRVRPEIGFEALAGSEKGRRAGTG